MNMIDEYKSWLCDLVLSRKMDRSYILLISELDSIDFYAICQDDYNRSEDGIDVRKEYIYENGGDPNTYHNLLYRGPCTVLECLIGIAKRMDYILYDPEVGEDWVPYFWELLENLGLGEYEDCLYGDDTTPNRVREIVYKWLSKKYKKNGVGNIFPIKGKLDIRKMSINQQMNLYIERRSV